MNQYDFYNYIFEDSQDYEYYMWEKNNEIDMDYYYNEFEYNQDFQDDDDYIESLIQNEPIPLNL